MGWHKMTAVEPDHNFGTRTFHAASSDINNIDNQLDATITAY